MPAGAADWSEVRKLYESGLSAPAIEKQIKRAVSRQAILKRARKEGWLQGVEGSKALMVSGTSGGVPSGPDSGSAELESPETLAGKWGAPIAAQLVEAGKVGVTRRGMERALAGYAYGATHKAAARLAGVTEATWIAWREDCPNLQQAIEELQSLEGIRDLQKIRAAGDRGDWKANEAKLRANPMMKEAWRDDGKASGGVVIQIAFGANMPPEAMKVIEE